MKKTHPAGGRDLRWRPPSPNRSVNPISVAAALASLSLHCLLVAPTFWGAAHHRRELPNSQGAPASHDAETADDAMSAFFIDESNAIREPRDATEDPATQFRASAATLLPVSKPNPSVALDFDKLDESERDTAQEASGDQTGRAILFGRYLGQISARIERAWMRPRTAVDGSAFVCRVQILQGRFGAVQEITLQQCNGDLRWQASLVQAIQSASPLPSPPDAAVFSKQLTLEFESDPFVPGGSEQGFEPSTETTRSIIGTPPRGAPTMSDSRSLPLPAPVDDQSKAGQVLPPSGQ
jgi:TonB C terminal